MKVEGDYTRLSYMALFYSAALTEQTSLHIYPIQDFKGMKFNSVLDKEIDWLNKISTNESGHTKMRKDTKRHLTSGVV